LNSLALTTIIDPNQPKYLVIATVYLEDILLILIEEYSNSVIIISNIYRIKT